MENVDDIFKTNEDYLTADEESENISSIIIPERKDFDAY